jgi:hypothetical protein
MQNHHTQLDIAKIYFHATELATRYPHDARIASLLRLIHDIKISPPQKPQETHSYEAQGL